MEVWVFSYNRGMFLENCVRSIELCAPHLPVAIFDDQSDDPETIKVLERLSKKHKVVVADAQRMGSKHGGLYGNMQSVIDGSEAKLADDVQCFVQDDTQFVRPIAPQETESIEALFQANTQLGFVSAAFIRGANKKADRQRTRFEPKLNGYFIDRFERSAGAYYSDISIFSVSRLRSVGWSFGSREKTNEAYARQHFDQMPYLKNPFVAWLPNVPAFRGKRQTLALKIATRQMGPDFCPFKIMTAKRNAEFCQRPPEEIPYAEDFLLVDGKDLPRPWRYYPLQGRRWLKRLNQLEMTLNKARGL